MSLTVEELKNKADHFLPAELSEEVKAAIDADARQYALESPRGDIASPYLLYISDRFYNGLKSGSFSGLPVVQWNGPDSFIFLESKEHPFLYRTSTLRPIQPKQLETDGGSIPNILRALKKFSPWGYAPAFIIHDWLFIAHKKNIEPDVDWSLESSAHVMAEAVKSLMDVGYKDFFGEHVKLEKQEDTLYLMYLAVKSVFSRRIWDAPTA